MIADRAAIQRHRLLERGRDVVVVDGRWMARLCLKQLTSASPHWSIRAPDDVAAITQYTSGNFTGTLKLCMHIGRRSLAGQACVQLIAHKVFFDQTRDVFATCPTAIHARVLSGWHAPVGGRVVVTWLFESDPETTATFFKRYRPTVVDTFPNVYICGTVRRWRDGLLPMSASHLDLRCAPAHDPAIAASIRAGFRYGCKATPKARLALPRSAIRWRHP